MIKTLSKLGNSYALLIDKALMEVMNITPDTPLHITVSGSTLTVTPVNVGFTDEQVDSMLGEVMPKYETMLKNLAR